MVLKMFCALSLGAAVPVASGAVLMSGSASTPAGLDGLVAEFRTLVSAGGANNGVGGGPFPNGRREVAWDAASLDPFQVPATLPGNFFNTFSSRGLVLSAPGGLAVSGRPASGSIDHLFSTINPAAADGFQAYSPERLFAAYGEPVIDATFFLPSLTTQRAYIRGFGAVFADVSVFGPTQLEAYGRNGSLLASVTVPPQPGGLSFAGIWIEDGEWIDHVRLRVGQTGIQDASGTLDIVALDDFIYAEPNVVPEPHVAALLAGVAMACWLRRSRPEAAWEAGLR